MIYAGKDGNAPVRSERWWEANMLGGSTMIWDANFPRYTDEDFRVRRYVQDLPRSEHMVDWPWSYDEFLPYFELAEWEWCVSGDAKRSAEAMRPGYEYPMPPLKPHSSTQFLMEQFDPAGLKPYFGARAINPHTYEGRPGCPFCGYNQFFGCAVNSRSNSVNTVLAKARSTGRCDVRTGHNVVRIDFKKGKNGSPGEVTGVTYVTEPGGVERHLSARRVFVSVQTIQSARLFLLSGIPDPAGLIGRFLTYHTKGDLHLTFKKLPVWDMGPAFQPRTAIGSLQLRGLYTYQDEEGALRKAGKFSVYDPYTCTTPLRLIKSASLGADKKQVWGEELVQYLAELRSQGGVSFSFTGDAMSLAENRVTLDPEVKDPWGLPVARTYYKHDPWDLAMSRLALDRVAKVMVDAGGEVRKYEPQDEANPGYGHVHGALRAGTDPGKSVLDANCQSHQVEGLYVLDAAWMPTAGASNPSLTLIANAYRVCSRIKKP
jgi:choline dehydrogenase-like flavoprotein